jgi:hypothetical protein
MIKKRKILDKITGKKSEDEVETTSKLSLDELSKPVTITAPDKRQKNMLCETDLKNPCVITDFDKVLRAINDAGTINAGKLRKDLKMDGAKLRECYLTLEKAGSVRIEYPLFGPPKLISAEFEKAKKRRDMIKRGEQLSDEDLSEDMHK